ncbi:MAG: response regulator transcription factor [Oscillospiraceae bacterium]|jgi:DNA-binding response OmpR family regulator|nr:response regulator transcription factor [Oscillospiraceae bacterium]
MSHILVVDDDIHIGNLLQEALEAEGFRVSRAYSGTEAVLALDRERPDLILLDLMLPGLSGEQVLPRLAGVPVIVVSARADVDSKTALLLGGAADYVTKPFALRELLARVAVRLREAPARAGGPLAFGPLRLDSQARSVSIDGGDVRLTRTEYAILRLLMANPAQVVTKSRLLDEIGQDTPDCTESSLKTHVSNLRKKLRDAGAGDPIESVWGIGFKMRTEQEESPWQN